MLERVSPRLTTQVYFQPHGFTLHGKGVEVGLLVFVGTSVGFGVRVSVAEAAGGEVGEAVGDGTAVDDGVAVDDGAAVKVAEADAVATAGVTVSVTVGSTRAVISCSPMPRTTATRRVSAMRLAAMSPLKSGPSPLAVLPFPCLSSGIILPLRYK